MRLSLLKLLAVAVAIAAAAGGYFWYQARNGAGEPKYRLGKVERGALQAVVVASGTLNAVTTVQVGSQISGQINEIFADFNTAVKKGQVIAQIDPATFELRVSQTRADLDAARSAVAVARSSLAAQQAEIGRVRINLADAQRDLERKQTLVTKNFLSPAELDKARTLFEATREQLRAVQAQLKVNESQVDSALAAVKQREALLKQAEVDLARTIIRAPVDGTVILRNVDAGQTVAASLQAPVLFTIAQDLRDMQVETAIDEADVGRLRVGQAATFTVDAFPRRSFAGGIRQIRKSPQNVQNVVSYTVVISASNPDLSLLPGMTANVRIVVDSRASALKVANAALRFRPGDAADAKPAAETPTQGSGAPTAQLSGAQALQRFRQRLFDELGPDDTQKQKIDAIFEAAREKFARLREIGDEGQRRRQAERTRAEIRGQIEELLDPGQKAAYERLIVELVARGAATTGRLWVLEGGRPKALEVRVGLSDGASTELLDAALKEGDEVIVGLAAPSQARSESGLPRFRLF